MYKKMWKKSIPSACCCVCMLQICCICTQIDLLEDVRYFKSQEMLISQDTGASSMWFNDVDINPPFK